MITEYKISLLLFAVSAVGIAHIPMDEGPLHMAPIMMEICDNAIDDDGDGLIDINDSDCACQLITPKSLIPNPSFEDRVCCPSNRSQLDCADGWIQASDPTTDYIHSCGWYGWEQFPPPQPFPDGDGIMGFRDGRQGERDMGGRQSNWKEYAGACLEKPLRANITYRFEFYVGFTPDASPAIDITFFGTPDCVNLPFGAGDEELGCPTNGPNWKLLGNTLISRNAPGPSDWKLAAIEITPTEDISAIAIGPPCRPSSSASSTYYFFDNLVLADLESFKFQISEVNHPCDDLFSLEMPHQDDLSYQWYKDGIALIGEKSAALSKMYGEGNYQAKVESVDFCGLSKEYPHFIPYSSKNISHAVCAFETFQFGDRVLDESGIYYDTLKTAFNCDSIITLQFRVQGVTPDTVIAKIFEGEKYEEIENLKFEERGEHLATINSSINCDSLILLQLDYYNVYIPNAFSPNGDGVNDFFSIKGGQDLVEISQLVIMDRWGNQVYNNANQYLNDSQGWDGTYKNTIVKAGTYVYTCSLIMDDNKAHRISGSILVLR